MAFAFTHLPLMLLPLVTAKYHLSMYVRDVFGGISKPSCSALTSDTDGHWCCKSGSLQMCFDEGAQIFWDTWNSSSGKDTYYHEWRLGALNSNQASYYTHTVRYFTEVGIGRLNYQNTSITVSPFSADSQAGLALGRGMSVETPSPLLVVPAETASFALCMEERAPLEGTSKHSCNARSKNADGYWCCKSGSLEMCFDENVQIFWRTWNSSKDTYYNEWYLGMNSSSPPSYDTHTVSYFTEVGHGQLNYARTNITVSPSTAGSQKYLTLV